MNLEDFKAIHQHKEQSGLNKKQFCEKHNIKLHIYNYWLRKLRDEKVDSPEFIELESANQTNELITRLPNGIVLNIPADFCSTHLKKLIHVLMQVC